MSYIEKKNIARNLRKRQTYCEKVLWSELRNKKLLNLKFRRQYPINKYIVDFFCYEKKLIIELDGPLHEDNEKQKRDEIRQRELECLGYKIIRFRNEDLISKFDYVLKEIEEKIRNI
jgi:uroporphyrinogen-III synthase